MKKICTSEILQHVDFNKIFPRKLKLKQIMEKTFKLGFNTKDAVTSVRSRKSIHGISYINGDIWIFQAGRIDVYNNQGRTKIRKNNIIFQRKKIYFYEIKMTHNGNIIAVDNKHLFKIDKNAKILNYIKRFRGFEIVDLCILKCKFAVLIQNRKIEKAEKYGNTRVLVFELIDSNKSRTHQWKIIKKIQISKLIINKEFYSSFLFHGHYFFISEIKASGMLVLCKYTYEGNYMGEVFQGKNRISLLGIDSQGQILAMESLMNPLYQDPDHVDPLIIIDPENRENVRSVTVNAKVIDVAIDKDDGLWIYCKHPFANLRYSLRKYSTK